MDSFIYILTDCTIWSLAIPIIIYQYIRQLTCFLRPPTSELRDELDRYLSTDPEQVNDVCKWWYERKEIYPRLHRMALDYLTIPGAYLNLS